MAISVRMAFVRLAMTVIPLMIIMGMVAVNDMGRYEMMHKSRDKLDSYDAAEEAADNGICCSFRRETAGHEIAFR